MPTPPRLEYTGRKGAYTYRDFSIGVWGFVAKNKPGEQKVLGHNAVCAKIITAENVKGRPSLRRVMEENPGAAFSATGEGSKDKALAQAKDWIDRWCESEGGK